MTISKNILLATLFVVFAATAQVHADSYTYTATGEDDNVQTSTCDDVYGRVFRGCIQVTQTDTTTGVQTTGWMFGAGFSSYGGEYNVVPAGPEACSFWNSPTNITVQLYKNGEEWNGTGNVVASDNITQKVTFDGGCNSEPNTAHKVVMGGLNTPSTAIVCPQPSFTGPTFGPSLAVTITLDGTSLCY
jgi:hypothetical protein